MLSQGNALYRQGKYEEARECYTKEINHMHSSHSEHTLSLLYSHRAQTYLQERNFEMALSDSTRALHYNPNDAESIQRKIIALNSLEKFHQLNVEFTELTGPLDSF